MRSWQHPRSIALVFLGGCLGSLLRAVLGWSLPGLGWVSTGIVNLVGSFVLGLLTGLVTRRPTERMASLRLFAGTGLCGAFTTYSAFSAINQGWIADGQLGFAVGYAGLSVCLGVIAAWAGFTVGER